MALHGPHHVAQKSVTTMRDEERIWAKCEAEVTLTVFDMVTVGVVVLLFCVRYNESIR